jgi:hypothetical protein
MISYKWSIEKMAVTGDANSVTHVYWRCDATDDVNTLTASCGGVTELGAPANPFTAYNDLTPAQVLAWVYETDLQPTVEAQVNAQLANQLAQKTIEPPLPLAFNVA